MEQKNHDEARLKGIIASRFDIVDRLARGETLPAKNRDHNLTGDYIGFRECHIQPDWLLIYRTDGDALLLFLMRTGTHADLFD